MVAGGGDGGRSDAAARDGGSPPGDGATGVPDSSRPPVPDAGPGETTMTSSVTHHGVTWTFASEAPVGRFVTGDYYVVGPVRVVSISPAPEGGRNGSVLNLPPVADESPWDERVEAGRYTPELRTSLPIDMSPGDRLLSSRSIETPGLTDNWLREGAGERSSSPVASISVLTCLASAPPADAFRPSYADPGVRIRRLAEIDRARLPRLAPPMPVDTAFLRDFAERFSRPWIDNLFFGFDAQVEYMPMYGREMGRAAGIASLLVMLDLPEDQRALAEQLLVGLVQRGIDLWGLVEAGHPGWQAHGGHGSGRKWPIVLAGLLFGDARMASPTVSYPDVRFGEDMQTAFASDLPYGDAWNGATVVYAGHTGIWDGAAVSGDPAWGPYEHLQPSAWRSELGESYRRCCTSLSWVGQALAARELGAEEAWAHDAFFAYVDRWMDPTGDAEDAQAIYEQTGWDFRAAWAAQGQAWDDLVEQMWATYR